MKTEAIRIVLRLPKPLNARVRRAAKRKHQTINKFTQAALAQWLTTGGR